MLTALLVRKFVKNPEDIQDIRTRAAYGKLSGIVCILCNIFLCIVKATIGALFGSVAVVADAFNNLSDAASNIVTILGFKLAERPADKEHPFGHGRYEYITGFSIAFVILFVGVELFRSGIDKILSPEGTQFGIPLIIALGISILVKLWMYLFNRKLGKKIHSDTLFATAADSRNDIVATTAVLLSVIVAHFTSFDPDGWMAIAVSLFILYGGISLIRSMIDPLLGKAPSLEYSEKIRKFILEYDGVLGTHDLLVHDYGPGRVFASAHVEFDSEMSFSEVHQITDCIERDLQQKTGIHLLIHADPVFTSGSGNQKLFIHLNERIKTIDPHLTIHDLSLTVCKNSYTLSFDCVAPSELPLTDEQLKTKLSALVHSEYPDYHCNITIDRTFAAIPHS